MWQMPTEQLHFPAYAAAFFAAFAALAFARFATSFALAAGDNFRLGALFFAGTAFFAGALSLA